MAFRSLRVSLNLSLGVMMMVYGAATRAQPIDTISKAVRITNGFETIPRNARGVDSRRLSDYRLLFDASYRFVRNWDLGVGLPTMTVYPQLKASNPILYSTIHFSHDPVWTALFMRFEPPFVDDTTGYRLTVGSPIKVPLGLGFEYFHFVGGQVASTGLRDGFVSYGGAVVYNLSSTFAIGPQWTLFVDKNGIDNSGIGLRFRVNITYQEKPIVVIFFRVSAPVFQAGYQPRLEETQMTLVGTWYIRV